MRKSAQAGNYTYIGGMVVAYHDENLELRGDVMKNKGKLAEVELISEGLEVQTSSHFL